MKFSGLVSILILNWNGGKDTLRAIKSALNQTYADIEIVVIDNGSTDESVDIIRKNYQNIKIVPLDKNYGCPGGRNIGVKECQGDFVFFCDNDGVLHKDAVKNSMKCILKDDRIAIVTGKVRNFSSDKEIDTQYKLRDPIMYKSNLFQGGISLHRKFVFSEIDIYPDDYLYGGEETYLSFRILDKDYYIVNSEEVVLWHKRSSNKRNRNQECLRAWGNALSNAYQLFPIEYFVSFFLYFFLKYPFYAKKRRILDGFIKESFNYLRRLKNYERRPVKRRTYLEFRRLGRIKSKGKPNQVL